METSMRRRRCRGKRVLRESTAAPQPTTRPPVTVEAGFECRPPLRIWVQSAPLLQAWPSGYHGGGLRLEGSDVVFFARGKPDLRILGIRC
jgi:hypothetical protein